jgi:hypothetical protein
LIRSNILLNLRWTWPGFSKPSADTVDDQQQAAGPRVAARVRRNHNLPRELSIFIGRERELAELQRLLDRTPLLTLVGSSASAKPDWRCAWLAP